MENEKKSECYEIIKGYVDEIEEDREASRGDLCLIAMSEAETMGAFHLSAALGLMSGEEADELFNDFVSCHLGYPGTIGKIWHIQSRKTGQTCYEVIKKSIDEMVEYRRLCDDNGWEVLMHESQIAGMIDLSEDLDLTSEEENRILTDGFRTMRL